MSKQSEPEIVETLPKREWLEPHIMELQAVLQDAFLTASKNALKKRSRKYLEEGFSDGLNAIQEAINTWVNYVEEEDRIKERELELNS